MYVYNVLCMLTTPIQTSSGLIPVPSKNTFHGLLQYVLADDKDDS